MRNSTSDELVKLRRYQQLVLRSMKCASTIHMGLDEYSGVDGICAVLMADMRATIIKLQEQLHDALNEVVALEVARHDDMLPQADDESRGDFRSN